MAARQAAALREFDVSPERGHSRPQASAIFRRHGLDSRTLGIWVQNGHLAHQDDRRWLTDKGREWATPAIEYAAVLAMKAKLGKGRWQDTSKIDLPNRHAYVVQVKNSKRIAEYPRNQAGLLLRGGSQHRKRRDRPDRAPERRLVR